jgi:hypothetical protein
MASDIALPMPWRPVLAGWPDEWRLAWGALSNALAVSGVAFPEDERKAFAVVNAQKAEVQRNGARNGSLANFPPPSETATVGESVSRQPETRYLF